jgi:hypothetical protein
LDTFEMLKWRSYKEMDELIDDDKEVIARAYSDGDWIVFRPKTLACRYSKNFYQDVKSRGNGLEGARKKVLFTLGLSSKEN